jgi:hypothetical protein
MQRMRMDAKIMPMIPSTVTLVGRTPGGVGSSKGGGL